MTTLRGDARTAAMELLRDYAASAGVKLQAYRARPASIMPPTAFVDVIGESLAYPSNVLPQRTIRVQCVLVHGLFDSGEAVDQADPFVDGFIGWVTADVHAAGGNTTIGVVEVEDDPTWVPDWMAPDKQRTYFATRIVLEVYAAG